VASRTTTASASSRAWIETAEGRWRYTDDSVTSSSQYDEEKKEYFLVAETAPAFRGGYVILFATGEGVPVLPPTASLPDGLIATEASSRSSPVVVTVGEVPAEVTYAGASPGLIIGILQINIRIPPNAAPGKAVHVSLRIRGLTSPPGTTLNIK